MDLRSEIENMFDEIISYNGNFGDPIATEFSFKPYDTLLAPNIDRFTLIGAGIGLLVEYAVYCDNDCYELALESCFARQVKDVLALGILSEFLSISNALNQALKSEKGFNFALNEVYKKHIVNWRKNAIQSHPLDHKKRLPVQKHGKYRSLSQNFLPLDFNNNHVNSILF